MTIHQLTIDLKQQEEVKKFIPENVQQMPHDFPTLQSSDPCQLSVKQMILMCCILTILQTKFPKFFLQNLYPFIRNTDPFY